MSEFYVTIGGKPVLPHPPTAPTQHVADRTGATSWEEGWQRETTRISVPVGILILLAFTVALLIRGIRKAIRDKRNL